MLRTNRMSGFTLIELMVVIVIIGVLASLAIPRFTEASLKAKVAEAPRVIASYESAFLAAVAEGADLENGIDDLVFTTPDSKWFDYDGGGVTSLTAAVYKATGSDKLTGGLATKDFVSTFVPGENNVPDSFTHTGTIDKKYAPNFF